MKKVAIVGGGAAGYFFGANLDPKFDIHMFEKTSSPLKKVKISGGGRCNVTHACYEPDWLIESYPRGRNELRSVFHRFQPGDTYDWFYSRGVNLTTEEDNRIFPSSNSSQSIIDCMVNEFSKRNPTIHLAEAVQNIHKKEKQFILQTAKSSYAFDAIFFATGSSPQSWKILEKLGFDIIKPVPSLFTFKIKHPLIKDLPGTVFQNAEVSIEGTHLDEAGVVLITHWGLSGPAILKLSAYGAIKLAELNYKFNLKVNFLGIEYDQVLFDLIEYKKQNPSQKIDKYAMFGLTKRFWLSCIKYLNLEKTNWQNLKLKEIQQLTELLTKCNFQVIGKSTFKDEFVTAGGLDLTEVNMQTMESKKIDNFYVGGECLNIDGITGGFNFQACWSAGYLAAQNMNENLVN